MYSISLNISLVQVVEGIICFVLETSKSKTLIGVKGAACLRHTRQCIIISHFIYILFVPTTNGDSVMNFVFLRASLV